MRKWIITGILAVSGILFFVIYHHPPSLITPSRGISSPPSKVILISFDGGSNELLHRFESDLPKGTGFQRIQSEGVLSQQGLEVTFPSLTAPSHISLVTGVPAGRHGIVSNQFHIPGDPIEKSVNGFTYPMEPGVKTVWEIVREQGKKVGGIAYPALDQLSPERSADWGISYTKHLSPGYLFTASKKDFKEYRGSLGHETKSYSPPLYTPFSLNENLETESKYSNLFLDTHFGEDFREEPSGSAKKHPFYLVAIDSTNDQKVNYDALLIDDDLDPKDFQGKVDRGQTWLGVRFSRESHAWRSGNLAGSWCKLLSLSPDLTDVQFYVGAVHSTKAYPDLYARQIAQEIGFWPGAPDRGNLGKGVTPEMIVEQSLRLADYLLKATLIGMRLMPWDLILTYQPMLDELEHQFLMIDPSQKDFSEQTSQKYMGYIKQGYLKANEIIEALLAHSRDSGHLVVVSDHGMAPLHHLYYPNRVLANRGYIEVDGGNPEGGKKTFIARAFSSGGISHLYVNLKDRESGGTVRQKDYELIRQELVSIFSEESQKPAVQKVLKREEAETIGLNHPHAGDVILIGNPGYHFTDALAPGNFLEPASFYGQHGYDPTLPVMKGIFAAFGPNLRNDFIQEQMTYKEIPALVQKLLR